MIMGSYRDPSGAIFIKNGKIYRSISKNYSENYNYFIDSGLYKRLVQEGLLISHLEINQVDLEAFKVIKPIQIPFVSYPYEWCFSQLKDAALTTLKIQKIAIDYGMCLKHIYNQSKEYQQVKKLLFSGKLLEIKKDDKIL